MTIEFTSPELTELTPKITVFGVGGAGGNAVNNMVKAELKGVDFVCANTDAQALSHSLAQQKIQDVSEEREYLSSLFKSTLKESADSTAKKKMNFYVAEVTSAQHATNAKKYTKLYQIILNVCRTINLHLV